MIEIFVESNWVFDYCAPRHRRIAEAHKLIDLAGQGQVRLHIPAICMREGAESVRRKCQPRIVSDMAAYRQLAVREATLSKAQSVTILDFFEAYKRDVQRDLASIDASLDELQKLDGVSVFALDTQMLMRVLAMRHIPDVQQLKPFDEAILAAVLVAAERLSSKGATDVRFLTKDADLWPWSAKTREIRRRFKGLYDAANVWVQSHYDTSVANPRA